MGVFNLRRKQCSKSRDPFKYVSTKAPAKSILAIAQIEKLANNNYSLILVPANQRARNYCIQFIK
jgi:hypothetical protein